MIKKIRNALMRSFLRLLFKKELSIPEIRKRSERMAQWVGRVSLTVGLEMLQIGDMSSLWIVPPGVDERRVILYLHGGGYVSGSEGVHKLLCVELSQTAGVSVLLPDYRLAPENPFPAALDDALAGYHWLLEQGFEPGNITIAGDSAGGGLTLATALALRNAGEALPARLVCISPWTDLKLTGTSYRQKAKADPILTSKELRYWALSYTTEDNLSNPLVSPLHADFYDFPPMLIQVGSEEILLDDSVVVAEKAKAAGVKVTLNIWPGMWHVWHATGTWLPESREALDDIGKFVSLNNDANKARDESKTMQ